MNPTVVHVEGDVFFENNGKLDIGPSENKRKTGDWTMYKMLFLFGVLCFDFGEVRVHLENT